MTAHDGKCRPMGRAGRGFEVQWERGRRGSVGDVGVGPEDSFTQAPAQVTSEVILELLPGSKTDSVTFHPARLLLPL